MHKILFFFFFHILFHFVKKKKISLQFIFRYFLVFGIQILIPNFKFQNWILFFQKAHIRRTNFYSLLLINSKSRILFIFRDKFYNFYFLVMTRIFIFSFILSAETEIIAWRRILNFFETVPSIVYKHACKSRIPTIFPVNHSHPLFERNTIAISG